MKVLRTWKKAHESDLESLVLELKDLVLKPAVVILSGPMGAGKTTFVRTFSKVIDPLSNATSPTYAVINEGTKVVHADFYRLETNEEVLHLELPLYLEGKDYFLVEWGKRFLSRLSLEVPEEFNFYELNVEIVSDEVRNFELSDVTDEL